MYSLIGYLGEKAEEFKGAKQGRLFERRAFTKMYDAYTEYIDRRHCSSRAKKLVIDRKDKLWLPTWKKKYIYKI
jgi:hypothetical protein